MKENSDPIAILGGGPAGLASALYACRAGLPVRIYEASESVGGNCRTLSLGPYGFDTGAHRLHDRDPEVTETIRALLGDDLLRIDAPSQILIEGRLVGFPLTPLDIATTLPAATLLRIAGETIALRLRGTTTIESFRDLALSRYGETLASLLLLGYSEKLWGAPAGELSPEVAGERLRGLDLRTFLREMLPGRRQEREHLDGAFYYPRHGIGQIFNAMAGAIGYARISLGSRVTSLRHDRRRITGIGINGGEPIDAGEVIATLPLPTIIAALDPAPPVEILELARSIRYRHLRLVVLALDTPRVSRNASIYFPDPALPFTRLFEPKNRSAALAPADSTAIVIEVPCSRDDALWSLEDGTLIDMVVGGLRTSGVIDRSTRILDRMVHPLPFAYPILEKGYERRVAAITSHLGSYANLHLAGRSARFQYSHIHDMFRQGREVVREVEEV